METPTQFEESALERPRDKRKVIVIAVLAVAVLGIGAFQFVGMSAAAPKSASKKSAKAKEKSDKDPESGSSPEAELKKQLVAQLVSGILPRRDPFQQMNAPTPTDPNAAVKETLPDRPKAPPIPRGGNPRHEEVPPFKIEGSLPPAKGSSEDGGKAVRVEKSAPLRQPNEFAYTLTGVIVGEKSMCVFQNDAGNQFLVPVGGKLDGDAEVTKISRGEVTVRHRGKDVTLKIGGH